MTKNPVWKIFWTTKNLTGYPKHSMIGWKNRILVISIWMTLNKRDSLSVTRYLRVKTGRFCSFPVFCLCITYSKLLSRSCHSHIKQPSLLLRRAISECFFIRDLSLHGLYQPHSVKFKSFGRVQGHQTYALLIHGFLPFLQPQRLRILLNVAEPFFNR